jgi:hypothetical protein
MLVKRLFSPLRQNTAHRPHFGKSSAHDLQARPEL